MMENLQSELDRLAENPTAAALLKNQPLLKRVLNSPDTKRLMALFQQHSGSSLQSAADSAVKGDTTALQNLANHIMASKEGAQLIQQIRKKLSQNNGQ